MVIRFIEEQDMIEARKLLLEVHQLHYENRPDIYKDTTEITQEYFSNLCREENTFTMVADEDGKIIGLCMGTLRKSPQTPIVKTRTTVLLDAIAVRQDYRGKGLGKRLYLEAQSYAREHGAESIELMAWAFNQSAIDFYQHMGMTVRSVTYEQRLNP